MMQFSKLKLTCAGFVALLIMPSAAIALEDTNYDLLITPNLESLPPTLVASMSTDIPVVNPRNKISRWLQASVQAAIMIPSDDPKPLGGGGARFACAVVSAADS
ncbi:hypothetical protein [[Limnothrix rosea] IAM M-220]|uniref:hypothetical protein n=1 Tax=[Limnothrix rosea] IAM M-220 TaxID=454133 RepID=UPI00095CAB4F|nr:hypothetical protein [[Limnothrix rosea] IAM M-220]OKH16924.1 hypothetical protein NIES208_11565 [[Limnothrix rosea] IAM M-220]